MKPYWCKVFGLGFGFEFTRIVSNDMKQEWTECSGKLYLGPLLLNFSFPITRRQPHRLYGNPSGPR